MNIINWFNRTVLRKKKEKTFYLEKNNFINGIFISFSTSSASDGDPTTKTAPPSIPTNIFNTKRKFVSSFIEQCQSGKLETPRIGKTIIITANGTCYKNREQSIDQENNDSFDHETVSYFSPDELITKSMDQLRSDIENNNIMIFDIEGMDLSQSVYVINLAQNVIANGIMNHYSLEKTDHTTPHEYAIDNIFYDGIIQHLIDKHVEHVSKFELITMSKISSTNVVMMSGLYRMKGVYRFIIEEKTIEELIDESVDNVDTLSKEWISIKENNKFFLESYADENTFFTVVDGKLCLKSDHPATDIAALPMSE